MKKTLSLSSVILLLLIIFWGAISWYLGTKAEEALKGYLDNNAKVVGKKLFRAELLDYKKSLIGADATLLVSSDYSAINERIGDFELKIKMFNGPFFIRKSGVKLGSSRWLFSFPDDAETNQKLKDFFPEKMPIAVVRVDFENKAHYWSRANTSVAETIVTGDYNIKAEENRGAITLYDFQYGLAPDVISADKINISYQHQKAITANYQPGTVSIQVENLHLSHHNLPKPLIIDLKGNSDISLKKVKYNDKNKDELNGFVKVDINNKQRHRYPFEKAKISLLFNKLSSDGLVSYNDASAELENLKQQIEWVLEEMGELPEGQDQIWELQDRIKEAGNALPQKLANLAKGSVVKLNIVSQYQNKASHLKGRLNLEAKEGGTNTWLSLLAGKARVSLSPSLFEALKKSLPQIKQKFGIQLKQKKLLMLP